MARFDVLADMDYIVRADGERLAVLAQLFDEGKLKLHVDEIVTFDRAPDALEIVAGKHVRGKIVLSIA
jgi:NADPH:quinone reductase-like Zn-dependent oxidoreductase